MEETMLDMTLANLEILSVINPIDTDELDDYLKRAKAMVDD